MVLYHLPPFSFPVLPGGHIYSKLPLQYDGLHYVHVFELHPDVSRPVSACQEGETQQ